MIVVEADVVFKISRLVGFSLYCPECGQHATYGGQSECPDCNIKLQYDE